MVETLLLNMKREYGKDGNNGTNGNSQGLSDPFSVCSVISVFSVLSSWIFLLSLCLSSFSQTPDKRLERERERAYAREQFTKNFRDLQVLGKGLLRDHEATRLTPGNLAKGVKAINKSARTLRSLIALGEMASEAPVNKEIDTAREFDESIRKLARLISDFAHNPVHQSNKVFNTDQAERAQTDLLTIINLSKALENKSRSYTSARLLSDK
jgi:hypothetical protein